jgi:xylan 1,4-beta-xylosidase
MSAGFAARAQAQTVSISVDATAAGTPLERVWPYHGYDEVNYSTTPEGEALLKTLATAHTAPVHVRTHFLLNTGDGTPSLKWGSTNVYTEDAAGNPVYSWTLMDGIMDAITGAGAFPFAEIGFMPEALSTHPTPYQNSAVTALDGGCFYPPTDYTKWGNLITAWATHENARYPNVASSWLWELWNEPDNSYWHGTFAEYAKLYDYTEAAIHGVLPTAQLGGPAVASAGSSYVSQLLQHCATGTNAVTGKTGTRLDLITFHAKGGTTVTGGHVEMNLGHQLSLHQTGFAQVSAVAAYKQTPIYITEADPDGCAACPATSTPADAYRYSPAYGAYEIAMMKHTLELEASMGVKVGGLLTWAFTFPGTPYFAGYRALATNGISLPVLSAFKLLGSLAGTRLSVTSSGAAMLDSILANSVRANPDIDAMATLNGQSIQVLVWNYHDDLVATAASAVQVTVKVPSAFGSSVTVSHMRVDETHGDAYTVWTSQGSPANPSAAQILALQEAMDPMPLNPPQSIAVSNGSVSVSFDLPRFGISLLTITPGAGVSDAGVAPADAPGGDAPSPTGGVGGGGGRDGGGGGGGTTGGGAGGSGVGTGGAGGSGGASGSTGSSGAGGGGVSGQSGGGSASSGGTIVAGGRTGTTGAGGVVNAGGSVGTGGSSAETGGSAATGGVIGTGGLSASGGGVSTGPVGTGGRANTGGTPGTTGGATTATSAAQASSGGCSCRISGVETRSYPVLALLGFVMVVLRLRRRRSRTDDELSPAASEDIPTTSVRKSSLPDIIEVFVGGCTRVRARISMIR